jgi:hypothetical protein
LKLFALNVKCKDEFSVPHCEIQKPQCGIYISQCGIQIPNCGTENILVSLKEDVRRKENRYEDLFVWNLW